MRNHLVLFLLLACPFIAAQATHYHCETVPVIYGCLRIYSFNEILIILCI